MSEQFIPSGSRIVIRPIVPKEAVANEGVDAVTESGLALSYVQGSEKTYDCEGVVVAVGDGYMGSYIPTWLAEKISDAVGDLYCIPQHVINESVWRYPMRSKIGDRVIYDVGLTTSVFVEGEELLCIPEEDVDFIDDEISGKVELVRTPREGQYATIY